MKTNYFSPKEIIGAINNENDKFAKNKLQAFLLITEGISPLEVSQKFSKDLSTIYNWVRQIKKEGLLNLKVKPGRGRKSFLTKKQFENLEKKLSKPIKTKDGYSRGWQSKDVIIYIKKKYNIEYSFSRIREILNHIGFKKIVSRPRSKRRNEALTQEFLSIVKKKEIYWVPNIN